MMEAHRDYTGSKIGMWLFLLSEILLFGGLFILYSVYRFKS
jgi:cytochrome c oxidase subunit 3